MSGQLQPLRRTPVSKSELTKAFASAWQDLFKTVPTKEQLGLLIAQNSLETGNSNSMWNYNIGNIKKTEKDSHNYCMLKHVGEIIHGKQVFFEPPHPATWFRAYNTLEEGVIDYLKFIKSTGKGKVWEAVLTGDPSTFSKALKDSHYYTASEVSYNKGLTRSFNQYMKENNGVPSTTPTAQPAQEIAKADSDIDLSFITSLTDFISQLSTDANTLKSMDKIVKTALYKKYLDKNNILLSIEGESLASKIEYAYLLSLALHEELDGKASIHTDGDSVEINCEIYGPKNACIDAVIKTCDHISDIFKIALKTTEDLKAFAMPDLVSSHKILSVKLAESSDLEFRKKFATKV